MGRIVATLNINVRNFKIVNRNFIISTLSRATSSNFIFNEHERVVTLVIDRVAIKNHGDLYKISYLSRRRQFVALYLNGVVYTPHDRWQQKE